MYSQDSARRHILPSNAAGSLVDLIYDAAAAPELWDNALTAVADALGRTSCILVGHREGSWREPRFADFGRLDRELNLKGSREDFCESPLMPRLGTLGVGQIISSDEIMPLAEARQTSWYREMMSPQDIAYCLMTPLIRDHGTFAAFFVAGSERAGAYSDADIGGLERLVPHLRRAAHIRCRVDSYRVLAGEQQALVNSLDTGIILIDETGAARCINPAAEEAVGPGGGFTLRGDVLSAEDRATEPRLKALIAATAAGASGATIALPRSGGREPLLVLVCPLHGTIRERLGPSRQQVALFIKDPARKGSEQLSDVLTEFYGLTHCESRVAVALASGLGVAGTAHCLNNSENTIKMHAKRVYEKLGLSGQVQLAQFYAKLISPVRPAQASAA